MAGDGQRHGLSHHPLYNIWCGIKRRCYNKKCPMYQYYGALGVKMWSGWISDFYEFYLWSIDSGWKKGLEIDRWPDKNGHYFPWNCRWATKLENQNNTRANVWIVMFNKRKTLTQWSVDPDNAVNSQTFRARIRLGWDPEEAFTAPPQRGKKPIKKRTK